MDPGMPWASYRYPLLIPATAPIPIHQLPELAAFLMDCPTGRPAPLLQADCANYERLPWLMVGDPSVYESARMQMAQELGFAPANGSHNYRPGTPPAV